MFASKSSRTKFRLVNALAELLSDGIYIYGERDQKSSFTLEANISMIINMTTESYWKYESKLMGSTFLERFLTIFHLLSRNEMIEIEDKFRKDAKPNFKILIKSPKNIENIQKYREKIRFFSKEYSMMQIKSISGSRDQIQALMKSHCILNNRNYICDDDIQLIENVKPYLENPLSPYNYKIIQLHEQGAKTSQIAAELGKNPKSYKKHIYQVLNKAFMRGLIENPITH